MSKDVPMKIQPVTGPLFKSIITTATDLGHACTECASQGWQPIAQFQEKHDDGYRYVVLLFKPGAPPGTVQEVPLPESEIVLPFPGAVPKDPS